jgi:hypothetical protein
MAYLSVDSGRWAAESSFLLSISLCNNKLPSLTHDRHLCTPHSSTSWRTLGSSMCNFKNNDSSVRLHDYDQPTTTAGHEIKSSLIPQHHHGYSPSASSPPPSLMSARSPNQLGEMTFTSRASHRSRSILLDAKTQTRYMSPQYIPDLNVFEISKKPAASSTTALTNQRIPVTASLPT